MKHIHIFFLAGLCAMVLSSCGNDNCGCNSSEPIDDTSFKIAYKLVDGSWDTLERKMPSTTSFWIYGSDGTYALYHKKNKDADQERLKPAVIDFKIISRTLVLDTAAKKVDIAPPDTLK